MHPADSWERPAPGWPPHDVRTVCDAYLDAVDEALPGLVEGLYLHGSLGFGEWYAGFCATWADLAAPAEVCPDVPCLLRGDWRDEGRFDVHVVTWHELARHGVTVRGPGLEEVDIWTDQRALRSYTHENLATYWADGVAGLARFPAEAVRADVVSWYVLGVPRLHHLLATDRLTSKKGGGAHAVAAFGERWRPLVTEALAYRATGERAGLLTDEQLAETVPEFAGLVVEAGLKIRP